MTEKTKKLKEEALYRLISTLVWAVASLLARSCRLQVRGSQEADAREQQGLPAIVVSWHGRTLIPTWYFGRRHWSAMISLSRDGEYQARIFRRFGWEIIRGSSGRGGVRALVGAIKRLREGATLAFTPDGPKGPSHTIHPGVLFLSQKAGCPIYPLGISAYPRVLLPTWDRYLIPRPFARAIMVYGEPIVVPPDLDPADFGPLAEELARRICDLERQAEEQVVPPGQRLPSLISTEEAMAPPPASSNEEAMAPPPAGSTE